MFPRTLELACAATLSAVMAFCVPVSALAQPASVVRPMTPEARASFEARMRAVEAIVAAVERGTGGDTLTAANLVWLRESLYRLSPEQLRAIGTPTSFEAVSNEITPLRVASLGSNSNELVYYPITPCRYIDTRNQGGPLNGTRTFDLSFTGGAFGGSIACDPKASVGGNEDRIGALAINVAIVGPTVSPGFLGVRPAGDTNTSALVNWWEQGTSVQASNAGVVTANQSPLSVAEIEFFGSPTHYVVDVFGVFAAPTATAMDCVVGGYVAVTADATNRNYALTSGACPAGYAKLSVNCNTPGGDFSGGRMRKAEGGINNPGATSTCSGYYAGTASVTVSAQALCCRIPGR